MHAMYSCALADWSCGMTNLAEHDSCPNRRAKPNRIGFLEMNGLDALRSLFTYDVYSTSILLPVIVALGELHPKGIFLEAIQVPRINLSHHVFGLPEAWLAAYSSAYTAL